MARMTLGGMHPHDHSGFQHEALLYAGLDEFLSKTAPLVRSAVDEERCVMVATTTEKLDALHGAVGDAAASVRFEDVTTLGRNPTRLTALWRGFASSLPPVSLSANSFAAVGIGEFVWPGRTPAELTEAQHQETLLDEALAAASLWLVCPYNVDALDDALVHEAARSHPVVRSGHTLSVNRALEHSDLPSLLEQPLEPRPPDGATTVEFTDLTSVRETVRRHAAAAGFDRARTEDAVTAVNELATNTIQHTPGPGTVTVWRTDDTLRCEVADGGHITDPLVGSYPPDDITTGGRGLWIVNHLCDLVQLRSSPQGTVVRIHLDDDR